MLRKMIDIKKYSTIVFDCDGVVLNSNNLKTQAFYKATEVYGSDLAKMLTQYHVVNGGISRYKKFDYFFKHILGKEPLPEEMKDVLEKFSCEVTNGLLGCEKSQSLARLKRYTDGANWLIVSGGDQAELRQIFEARNIAKYFDGGIYGSPDTKEDILLREKEANIRNPALFIGDSKYDYEVANKYGLDFLFVSDWSEVVEWKEFVRTRSLPWIKNLDSLGI